MDSWYKSMLLNSKKSQGKLTAFLRETVQKGKTVNNQKDNFEIN